MVGLANAAVCNQPRRLGGGIVLAILASLAMPALARASEGGGPLPPAWAVLPFVLLLGMIATGPLFYHHFWEKYYPHVSIGLGLLVSAFYIVALNNFLPIYHSFVEYLSFIALLGSLFVASGAILIEIDKKGTPLLNTAILFIGCLVANVIGTTGASMLLIRPFMRVNRGRIKAYHIIFFIFTVSNVGGALTPIGDPPLFMGFLRGVPFFWIVTHIWHIWAFTLALILAVFFVIDTINVRKTVEEPANYAGTVKFTGLTSLFWLALIIGAVFLDPNVIQGFPDLRHYGIPLGIREFIMFGICFGAYKTANKDAMKGNNFNFGPIMEVAYLFVGIFLTMVPALELIAYEANAYGEQLTPGLFYFGTGFLSSVLDNTPTYVNFLTAALGKYGMVATNPDHVKLFISCPETLRYIVAISAGAVFWGAVTYIGNGPNFMVKAISDQNGVRMPSFFGYVFKYALPILIPIFILVWLLFFMIPSGDHDMIMQDCAQIYEIWKGAAAVAADSLSVVH
jgi:Na+/H+ antiporter NhaD/arsenite permease-like protein